MPASAPMWAFMPIYHWLLFFVWCISGSLMLPAFFVEDGAAMIVASTMDPRRMIQPCSVKISFCDVSSFSPSSCFSSRWKNAAAS